MLKRNQKGFSLVELIIVIAIAAVLGAGAFAGISRIRFANTEKAMREIESALDKLQVESMSRQNPDYLYIYQSDEDYYWKRFSSEVTDFSVLDDSGEKIGNSAITVQKDGTNVSDTNVICVRYNRSGAYGSKTNVSKIGISGGTDYTITLMKSTGKHIVD